MALTKVVVEDRIEVLELGHLQIRTKTAVLEDGVELSSSFHRHVLAPCAKISGSWTDTDVSGESAKVQALAAAVWTDAVKTAYQTFTDASVV
jgi:hypothetical protein